MSTAPPHITEAAYQQLSDDEKRRLGYQRPLSDAEFSQLTPEQLQQFGFAPKEQGAPADFGGTVYPNPNNLKPFSDTDTPEPTRLPTGVSLQHQNSTGQMPSDLSNPPATQIAAPGQTAGASFSPDAAPPLPAGYQLDQTADSAPPLPAGYQLDPHVAEDKPQPGWLDKEIPLTSYGAATEQGVQSLVKGFRDTAKGMYDTLAKPPQDNTEKGVEAIGPAALPLYRTLVGAGHTAEQAMQIVGAVHDINNSSDPTGTYAKVLQDTAGTGAAQALTALATEGVIKVAPKVLDTVTSPTKMAAPVRLAAKATNAALKAVPDVAGGAAGAYLGHATGLPEGGLIGAIGGRQLGRAIADRFGNLQIPGEGAGLPNSVEGGPASAPQYQAPAEAPAATPAPEAQAAAPDTSPSNLSKLLNDAVGGKPLEPNVPLRAQANASATTPELPEGFTPVKSSAIKGYKYNPDTQEFDGITNTGQVYRHGEVTPDQVKAFESADSKGKAWNELRGNATPLGKVNNGVLQPRIPSRTVVEDPETGRPEFSDVVAAKKPPQSQAAAASGDEDLTSILQNSLEQAQAKKPPQSAALPEPQPGGIMTTAEPGMLADRWGVTEKSLQNTRENTRGMSPQDTEESIQKLTDLYKKGHPVEPVMETRDADNNIVSVDGRGRAIAAKRAGIDRIPIMIRRLRAAQ